MLIQTLRFVAFLLSLVALAMAIRAGPADMHLVGDVITLALPRCVHTRFRITGVTA